MRRIQYRVTTLEQFKGIYVDKNQIASDGSKLDEIMRELDDQGCLLKGFSIEAIEEGDWRDDGETCPVCLGESVVEGVEGMEDCLGCNGEGIVPKSKKKPIERIPCAHCGDEFDGSNRPFGATLCEPCAKKMGGKR